MRESKLLGLGFPCRYRTAALGEKRLVVPTRWCAARSTLRKNLEQKGTSTLSTRCHSRGEIWPTISMPGWSCLG